MEGLGGDALLPRGQVGQIVVKPVGLTAHRLVDGVGRDARAGRGPIASRDSPIQGVIHL